jgi:protease-4
VGAPRRLAANGLRLATRLASRPSLPARSGCWLTMEVGAELSERTHLGFGRPALGLMDLLRALEAAGIDDRVEGVLLCVRGEASSWSQASSLRRAVDGLREAGKRVVVFAERLSAEGYLVASGADRIWLPGSGQLFLVGLRAERFYLRDLLERIGAKPEVVHVGRFKSAGETFTRGTMSDTERKQIEGWQADVFDELIGGVARGRGLEPSAVRDLVDRGPYVARAAAEAGLADELVYEDELPQRLESLSREPAPGRRERREVHLVPVEQYFAARLVEAAWQPVLRPQPALVYLLGLGGVHRGSGPRGITSEGTGELLEQLRTEPAVRGVVLRLDSPGGDALASDLLHRRVEQLRHEKPVVVSMGDVVASGGYYIAAAADSVYAEPGTVTGSIGVVGGKLNLEGLYERLGVAKDGVQQGARAGLLREARGYTPDERQAVRKEMDAIYDTFLDRVADSRRLTRRALEEIAQGRIWSGRQAIGLGLVDALGGPLEALRDLRARAGFQAGERLTLVTLPKVPRLPGWLSMLMRSGQ